MYKKKLYHNLFFYHGREDARRAPQRADITSHCASMPDRAPNVVTFGRKSGHPRPRAQARGEECLPSSTHKTTCLVGLDKAGGALVNIFNIFIFSPYCIPILGNDLVFVVRLVIDKVSLDQRFRVFAQ